MPSDSRTGVLPSSVRFIGFKMIYFRISCTYKNIPNVNISVWIGKFHEAPMLGEEPQAVGSCEDRKSQLFLGPEGRAHERLSSPKWSVLDKSRYENY